MIYLRFFGSMAAFSAFIFTLYFGIWTACALIDRCAAQNGLS